MPRCAVLRLDHRDNPHTGWAAACPGGSGPFTCGAQRLRRELRPDRLPANGRQGCITSAHAATQHLHLVPSPASAPSASHSSHACVLHRMQEVLSLPTQCALGREACSHPVQPSPLAPCCSSFPKCSPSPPPISSHLLTCCTPLLSCQATEADLRPAFTPAGFVWELTLPRSASGRGRGFAFVGFTCKAHAGARVRVVVWYATLRSSTCMCGDARRPAWAFRCQTWDKEQSCDHTFRRLSAPPPCRSLPPSPSPAERAIKLVNGQTLAGRPVAVDWAVAKAQFDAKAARWVGPGLPCMLHCSLSAARKSKDCRLLSNCNPNRSLWHAATPQRPAKMRRRRRRPRRASRRALMGLTTAIQRTRQPAAAPRW